MNDFVSALIRTLVPLAIGHLAAWLISLGINLDQSTFSGLEVWLGALLSGAYYAGIRALEQRFPWVGWFLGLAKQPVYIKQGEAAVVVDTQANVATSVVEVAEDGTSSTK